MIPEEHIEASRKVVYRLQAKGYEIERISTNGVITWTTKSFDPDKPRVKRPYKKRAAAKKVRHPELGATLTVTTLGLDKDGSILVGFAEGWVARLEDS